jgi:ubiquinone/menaquinone biosynthesis C-methylase UbiE
MLVDVQTEMLVAARQRLARAANVWYGAADACALPIRTGQSDAVFLATMLGEVPGKDLCIEEVRRIRPRPGRPRPPNAGFR